MVLCLWLTVIFIVFTVCLQFVAAKVVDGDEKEEMVKKKKLGAWFGIVLLQL